MDGWYCVVGMRAIEKIKCEIFMFFLFGLSLVVTEIENDGLRRWIRKIGRLQVWEVDEKTAKVRKDGGQNLENAITAWIDYKGRGERRCGHVV